MTIKKLTVIAAAGAVLLAGAIGLSMNLTSQHEMEMEVPETPVVEEAENGFKTLGDMENIPLYFDETEKLLLPLRNVMEGLGGSVVWNKDTKMTEVSYRGRTLALVPGEKEAKLNGYDVTLPVAAEVINGCLYADEKLISAYYTGDVDFNVETRQVSLQTKDTSVPVVAVKEISGEKEGKSYTIEVPVMVGLNDSKYEASLNDKNRQELQEYADAYMEADGDGTLLMKLQTLYCTKDFVSLLWEGHENDSDVKLAENIDLQKQKTVTLADMISEASLEKAKKAGGEGWTEDRFCLTAEGGLVLLKGSNEESENLYYWTTEGEQPEWKEAYQPLLGRK